MKINLFGGCLEELGNESNNHDDQQSVRKVNLCTVRTLKDKTCLCSKRSTWVKVHKAIVHTTQVKLAADIFSGRGRCVLAAKSMASMMFISGVKLFGKYIQWDFGKGFSPLLGGKTTYSRQPNSFWRVRSFLQTRHKDEIYWLYHHLQFQSFFFFNAVHSITRHYSLNWKFLSFVWRGRLYDCKPLDRDKLQTSQFLQQRICEHELMQFAIV